MNKFLGFTFQVVFWKAFFLFKTKFFRWIQTLIFVGLGVHFMTKGYVSLPAKTLHRKQGVSKTLWEIFRQQTLDTTIAITGNQQTIVFKSVELGKSKVSLTRFISWLANSENKARILIRYQYCQLNYLLNVSPMNLLLANQSESQILNPDL